MKYTEQIECDPYRTVVEREEEEEVAMSSLQYYTWLKFLITVEIARIRL